MSIKKQAQELLKRLKELSADHESMLLQAEEVYRMAVDGYDTELPSKEGVSVTVIQKMPAVAVQAIQIKKAIVKDLVEFSMMAEEGAEENTQPLLVINLGALKDERGAKPEGI